LLEKKVDFVSRDLDKQRLREEELDSLIGERDYKEFLNTRNELFRTEKMKEKPPTRAQAIRLMAAHPNLIRRPILIHGQKITLGLVEEDYRELAKA